MGRLRRVLVSSRGESLDKGNGSRGAMEGGAPRTCSGVHVKEGQERPA